MSNAPSTVKETPTSNSNTVDSFTSVLPPKYKVYHCALKKGSPTSGPINADVTPKSKPRPKNSCGSKRKIRRVDSTPWANRRSEEHTSELQSRGHLVCCLLL